MAPSGSRHTRDWTLKEKAKLLKALQTVTDPDDYESVASHIVTRLVVIISEHKKVGEILSMRRMALCARKRYPST